MNVFRIARRWIGVALIVFGVCFYFDDVRGMRIAALIVLAVAGAFVIVGPRRLLDAQRRQQTHYRALVQSDPRSARLEKWSRWLSWLMPILATIPVYLLIKTSRDPDIRWIIATVCILFAFSTGPSMIVMYRTLKLARAKKSAEPQ